MYIEFTNGDKYHIKVQEFLTWSSANNDEFVPIELTRQIKMHIS
jgi:hypothetical protein